MMKPLAIFLGLWTAALLVAGVWYGQLLHAPAEPPARDPELEAMRRVLFEGIDGAILTGRELSRELAKLEADRPPAVVLAGFQ
jgi:DNA-binding LacI/PurR family transcriptional regulator